MDKYLPDHKNPNHLKIAELATKISLLFILVLVVLTAFVFWTPIKTYSSNLYTKTFRSLFRKSPEQILSIIRKEIIPSVVQVGCMDATGQEAKIGSGIFYYSGTSSVPTVETNAHVVIADDGQYYGCFVYFPRPADGTFYETSYKTGDVFAYHDSVSKIDDNKIEGIDYAQLTISGPNTDEKGVSFIFPPKASDVFTTIGKMCTVGEDSIQIGEKIYVIGYPGTGGNSVTMTEGVISGFSDGGDGMLKISASTNHGNSGGIVIGQNTGCYYGILSAGTQELGGNLGYALSSGYVDAFLANLTQEKTYEPPATTTKASAYLKQAFKLGDVSLKYPTRWTIATTTSIETNGILYSLNSPKESALDDFSEGLIVESEPINDLSLSEKEIVGEKGNSIITLLKDNGVEDIEQSTIMLDNNHKAYVLSYYDKSGKMFGLPAYSDEILFIHKNNSYRLTFILGDNRYTEIYSNILNGVLKTLVLR